MKKLLLLLFILFSFNLESQVIYFDYIENRNWLGTWEVGNGNNTGSYNNFFVSSNLSAVLIGKGGGSSPTEDGVYFLPNITGLSPNNSYLFSFRLASYRTSSTGTTSGVDASDFMNLSVSTDGGNTWTSEIRITGFNNAFWGYNNNSMISKIRNGTLITYTPSGGGNRTSTGDGYSMIILELPTGITQCSFRISLKANSDGEEWWIDNIELSQVTALPVELIEFYVEKKSTGNLIKWKTASENNSSHFIIKKSITGYFNDETYLAYVEAAGDNVGILNYEFFDFNPEKTINYYKLLQYDIDGQFQEYDIIASDNREEKKVVVNTFDLLGRPSNEYSKGIIIIHYSDGSYAKKFQN